MKWLEMNFLKDAIINLKQWLWNISSVDGTEPDIDEKYKFILLNILSYIGIFLLSSFGIRTVLQHNYSLAAWEIGTLLVIAGNLVYLRKGGNYRTIMYTDIFFIGILFEYLFITGGVNNTGHLWTFTFPLFTLFMLGLHTGTIVTILFLAIPIIVLYAPWHPIPVQDYSPEFKLRFFGSFFLVYIFTFFYEFVRATTQQVTEVQNIELEFALTNLKKTDAELKRARDRLEATVEERTLDLTEANRELTTALSNLKDAQFQLLQTEKLASIGQLASGIAHEINTPTQYVGDNTRFFKESFDDLQALLVQYNRLFEEARKGTLTPELLKEIGSAIEESDVDYLTREIPKAIQQSLDGVTRVTQIVAAMKDFAHPDTGEKSLVDVNKAIENTIAVSRSEWKYVATVTTSFDDDMPHVLCHQGQFNQVILNIIINAAHAIGEVGKDEPEKKGVITLATSHNGSWAEIRISDTGGGISEEIRSKIFDHFFTTKEIGKGTGQGLAISHDVIVEKHGGSLTFESELGKGATFIIRLPLSRDEE